MSNPKTDPNDLTTAYGYANNEAHFDSQGGLTKREHFAAMAMQGLLSNSTIANCINYDWAARNAVEFADHLINKLNR